MADIKPYQHQVNPDAYPALLDDKAERLRQLFAGFQPPELEVHPSAPQHFRLRAEFRLWHEGERCFYAMSEPGDKTPNTKCLTSPSPAS